jgi:hypothetical protein
MDSSRVTFQQGLVPAPPYDTIREAPPQSTTKKKPSHLHLYPWDNLHQVATNVYYKNEGKYKSGGGGGAAAAGGSILSILLEEVLTNSQEGQLYRDEPSYKNTLLNALDSKQILFSVKTVGRFKCWWCKNISSSSSKLWSLNPSNTIYHDFIDSNNLNGPPPLPSSSSSSSSSSSTTSTTTTTTTTTTTITTTQTPTPSPPTSQSHDKLPPLLASEVVIGFGSTFSDEIKALSLLNSLCERGICRFTLDIGQQSGTFRLVRLFDEICIDKGIEIAVCIDIHQGEAINCLCFDGDGEGSIFPTRCKINLLVTDYFLECVESDKEWYTFYMSSLSTIQKINLAVLHTCGYEHGYLKLLNKFQNDDDGDANINSPIIFGKFRANLLFKRIILTALTRDDIRIFRRDYYASSLSREESSSSSLSREESSSNNTTYNETCVAMVGVDTYNSTKRALYTYNGDLVVLMNLIQSNIQPIFIYSIHVNTQSSKLSNNDWDSSRCDAIEFRDAKEFRDARNKMADSTIVELDMSARIGWANECLRLSSSFDASILEKSGKMFSHQVIACIGPLGIVCDDIEQYNSTTIFQNLKEFYNLCTTTIINYDWNYKGGRVVPLGLNDGTMYKSIPILLFNRNESVSMGLKEGILPPFCSTNYNKLTNVKQMQSLKQRVCLSTAIQNHEHQIKMNKIAQEIFNQPISNPIILPNEKIIISQLENMVKFGYRQRLACILPDIISAESVSASEKSQMGTIKWFCYKLYKRVSSTFKRSQILEDINKIAIKTRNSKLTIND